MAKFQTLISWLVVFLYSLVYSALLLDAYKNPQKFEQTTFIQPWLLIILILLINLLIRYKEAVRLHKFFIKLNKLLIFPIFTLLTIIISLLTYYSPPNYVYSHLPINSQSLLLIAIFSGMAGLINSSREFLKKYYRQIIFLLPLLILGLGLVVSLWPNDVFIEINKEDHLVENTQFLLLVLACIFATSISVLALESKQRVDKTLGILYIFVAIGLFFIAGEEVSWGQRVFGIVTPEYIANQNSQGEITIHNLKAVNQFVNFSYLALGLYGSLSWILNKLKPVSQLKLSRFFFIPWYLTLYFFPIFIYNLLLPPNKPHGLGEWSEMTELLLYGGMLGTVLGNFIYLAKKKRIEA